MTEEQKTVDEQVYATIVDLLCVIEESLGGDERANNLTTALKRQIDILVTEPPVVSSLGDILSEALARMKDAEANKPKFTVGAMTVKHYDENGDLISIKETGDCPTCGSHHPLDTGEDDMDVHLVGGTG